MAITNGYCTLAELKWQLDITSTDATRDTHLEEVVEGVSRWIDSFCNRYFYADDSATKYFSAVDHDYCVVQDLRSITTLKTDNDGDRTYERTWSATDYDLMPFDQPNDFPYTHIRPAPNGSYTFPSFRKGVEIVGNFGWASVPFPIKQACLIQAERVYMRKDAPFGIAGDSRRLSEIHIVSKLDPDVQSLLTGYQRFAVT